MSRLADLAQANLLAIGEPRSDVGFTITHRQDLPGYVRDLLREPQSELRQPPLDTFGTASFGIGTVLSTHEEPPDSLARPQASLGLKPWIGTRNQKPPATDRRMFAGGAPPNPTFLYEGRATLEGLIILDLSGAMPTLDQATAMRDVIHEISNIAYTKLHAPILSIQAPAQVTYRDPSVSSVTGYSDHWKRSYDLAVRFSIASGQLLSADRQSALKNLLDLCEERGFGIFLRDPRPSHRSGDWFDISLPATVRQAQPSAGPSVTHGYPITFVGPARVGSTAAVMQCLSQFSDLGILSCSVTPLSDLAFISIVVGLTDEQVERAAWQRLSSSPQPLATDGVAEPTRKQADAEKRRPLGDALRDVTALRELLTRLGFSRELGNAELGELEDRAGDYVIAHGPLTRATRREDNRCVWFSIETQHTSESLNTAITSLYEAVASALYPLQVRLDQHPKLQPENLVPNIEYLMARVNNGGLLRVRGKFSIEFAAIKALAERTLPNTSRDKWPTFLCRAIEEQWSQHLRERTETFAVSVSWQENWLGHWSGRSTETSSG